MARSIAIGKPSIPGLSLELEIAYEQIKTELMENKTKVFTILLCCIINKISFTQAI